MRIYEIPLSFQQSWIGYALQIDRSRAACLGQVDRQFRKSRTAGHVRLHDFRTARKESDIDIVKRAWRNDLGDLDFSCELLKQSRILFRFEQRQPSDRQTSSL